MSGVDRDAQEEMGDWNLIETWLETWINYIFEVIVQ